MLARKYVQIVKKTESMLLWNRVQVMTGVSELSKFSNILKRDPMQWIMKELYFSRLLLLYLTPSSSLITEYVYLEFQVPLKSCCAAIFCTLYIQV
jgi:hypothetical protein